MTVYVQDISCGPNKDRVQVCYQGSALCVASGAVDAYLAKGAYLGPCDDRSRSPYQPVVQRQDRQQAARFMVYPNPTQGRQATLEFVLEEKAAYSIEVYNLQGTRVARLEAGVAEAGERYKVPLDGSRLPTGMYLTRLAYGNHVKVLKMVNGF